MLVPGEIRALKTGLKNCTSFIPNVFSNLRICTSFLIDQQSIQVQKMDLLPIFPVYLQHYLINQSKSSIEGAYSILPCVALL